MMLMMRFKHGEVNWKSLPGDVGKFEKDGMFHATKSGSASIKIPKQKV